jgi:hypothetical protein
MAPRLGLAIGSGKTVVRASGGIFYDPFQTDLYRRALLNNGSPQYFAISLLAQQPFAPSFPNVLPTSIQGLPAIAQDITAVSPDFSTLYSANANVSASRELSSDLAVTATYLFHSRQSATRSRCKRSPRFVAGGPFLMYLPKFPRAAKQAPATSRSFTSTLPGWDHGSSSRGDGRQAREVDPIAAAGRGSTSQDSAVSAPVFMDCQTSLCTRSVSPDIVVRR